MYDFNLAAIKPEGAVVTYEAGNKDSVIHYAIHTAGFIPKKLECINGKWYAYNANNTAVVTYEKVLVRDEGS